MNNRRGSALLTSIVICSTLLLLAVFLLKIVYNGGATARNLVEREKAFWLAEAGLELGKVKVNQNNDWYTDLPHYPTDDSQWLKTAAVGEVQTLGEGMFKTVREEGGGRLYAIGILRKAVVVLKITFNSQPFKFLAWSEI